MALFDHLMVAFEKAATLHHGGEAISELQHALQAADLASAENADADLVLAALLHDIGRFAIEPPNPQIGRRVAAPEILGAELVAPYLSARIVWCLHHHITARRYLAATQRLYVAGLSPAARRDLSLQGGPLTADEVHDFAAEAWALDALQLRRCCDRAKEPGKPVRGLDYWETELRRVFSPSATALPGRTA